MEDFKKKIFDRVADSKKLVFMGIGEEKLSDDGFGPYVISELLEFSNEKVLFINAGTDPMARIDEIIDFKPSHLILLDTCSLNALPGTVALLERENMTYLVPISSHTIPVHIFIDLIKERIANIDVFMIGVVPESLDGFTELRLYKQEELSLDERSNNIDLPFFDIQLTYTIQNVADKIIIIIKDLIKER